ncbi:MAG: hypothetical protein ACKOWG_01070 [Planctomycetia bacterium]
MNVGESGRQIGRLIHVFMDHPIAKLSDPQPPVCGIKPAIPFGTIKIRRDRLHLFATHPQDERQ